MLVYKNKHGTNESESTMVKKRNKPSFTCTNCRKRKIKCDRRKPCTSCIKFKKEPTCKYSNNEPSVIFAKNKYVNQTSKIKVDDEIIKQKKRKIGAEMLEKSPVNLVEIFSTSNWKLVRNDRNSYSHTKFEIPLTDDNDFLDLHKGYCNVYIKEPFRRVNIGPLTWSCFFNKDPWLKILWRYSNEHGNVPIYNNRMPNMNKEDSSMFKSNDDDESKEGIISEKIFCRRILEQDGYEEQAPYKSLNNLQSEQFINKIKKLNPSSILLTRAMFEGKFDAKLHLFEKIKIVTPKKKALWSLVDIFFQKLYPFMPFIDQKELMEKLTKIFGPVSYLDEYVEEVKILRKLDLITCAQFLIIIRLTYLSLFSNRECVNEYIMNHSMSLGIHYDLTYLLSIPINLTTIDVAKSCIESFQFARRPNLSILQALLLMRIYHELAPEYGDGVDGGDSMISYAILVQMAVSLGLNREPNEFINVCHNERNNNLGRKIWAVLVEKSYINSILSGLPCTIHIENSDVMDPFFNGKNSNIIDTDLEITIMKEFTWIPNRISLDKFLKSIINIKEPIRISNFIKELNNIEDICINKLFTIGDIKEELYMFQEIKRAHLFLQLRSSLLTIYSHLFLHYESKNNSYMSFFYVKKQLLILYEEIIPYYFEIKFGKYSSFGLTLIPSIENCFHKADHLILCLLARIVNIKLSLEKKINHVEDLKHNTNYHKYYDIINSLVETLNKVGDLIVSALSKFATRYYYAWRIAKCHTLFFKFMKNLDFYDNPTSLQTNLLNFSTSQLYELEKLFSSISDALFSITSFQDSFDKRTTPNFKEISVDNSNSMVKSPSFSTNMTTDKIYNEIWLSMLQNQLHPIFDSEIEMLADSIGRDSIFNFNLGNNSCEDLEVTFNDL